MLHSFPEWKSVMAGTWPGAGTGATSQTQAQISRIQEVLQHAGAAADACRLPLAAARMSAAYAAQTWAAGLLSAQEVLTAALDTDAEDTPARTVAAAAVLCVANLCCAAGRPAAAAHAAYAALQLLDTAAPAADPHTAGLQAALTATAHTRVIAAAASAAAIGAPHVHPVPVYEAAQEALAEVARLAHAHPELHMLAEVAQLGSAQAATALASYAYAAGLQKPDSAARVPLQGSIERLQWLAGVDEPEDGQPVTAQLLVDAIEHEVVEWPHAELSGQVDAPAADPEFVRADEVNVDDLAAAALDLLPDAASDEDAERLPGWQVLSTAGVHYAVGRMQLSRALAECGWRHGDQLQAAMQGNESAADAEPQVPVPVDKQAGIQAACEVLQAVLAAQSKHAELFEKDLYARGLLASTLAQLGLAHHAMGSAVTAEGLYRSAIDSFRDTQAELTKRGADGAVLAPPIARNWAQAVGGYGALLAQWDKRAGEAQRVVRTGIPAVDAVLAAAGCEGVHRAAVDGIVGPWRWGPVHATLPDLALL